MRTGVRTAVRIGEVVVMEGRKGGVLMSDSHTMPSHSKEPEPSLQEPH